MPKTAIESFHWTDAHGHPCEAGDPVKVAGERGVWTFISAWVQKDGTADVWVRGGTAGRERRRAFSGGKVLKSAAKVKRKLS